MIAATAATTATVTVTTRGRVTLPKSIRVALRIAEGAQLDFQLSANGTVSIRALKSSATEIVGLLKRPGQAAATVEQMIRALCDSAAERYRLKATPARGRSQTKQEVRTPKS